MGSVSDLAVPLLLMVVTMTDPSRPLSVCHLPACYCASSADTDPPTGQPALFRVTCFVTSFSQSDPAIQKLTPNVTSLKLICSDSSARNHLTPMTFRQLPRLEKLGLENCFFASVSSNALEPVPELQELEIRQCVFSSEIPFHVFNTTVKLSQLSLTQCALHSVPRLCSLHNHLQLLNVSGQYLTSVDRSVEDCGSDTQFEKLAVLDVSNNSLSKLPHVLLNIAPNLRELYLQDNQISDLSWSGCTKLEVLDILGQEIERVDFMRASCVLDFKVLKLQGNGSELFPISDLQGMSNLTILHLQNMTVDDSIWEVVSSLRNLSHLALPVNNLTTINLTREVPIQHLNLSRNAITILDNSTFSSHRDLRVIDLSWNKVSRIMGSIFINMTFLHILDLQHNQLRMVLQRAFHRLPSLKLLNLNNNQLTSLPMFLLREMKALKVLSVEYNRLRFLPSLRDAEQLVLVTARFNQLSYIPTFSGVPNLEYLYLRGNKLTHVRSAIFLKAPTLAYLDLSENNITRVDRFHNHPGLLLIRMEHNLIQDLTFVFQDLPRLNVLYLDYNRLFRLTRLMVPTSLRTLTLSYNLLTYIEPRLFLALPHLIAVTLGVNSNLYRLPWSSVQISPEHLPKPAFTVAPNTFVCDCRMAYLKAWSIVNATGDSNSELLAHMPEFLNLHVLDCVTYFTGDGFLYFEDTPLSDFVCPLKETLCDDFCPCCDPQSHSTDANCSCLLTCPHNCTCFHGGSQYVHLYTHIFCDRQNRTQIPDKIPARATHIRLDGNRLGVITNTTLTHISGAMFLYLNHSEIETLEESCFEGMDVLKMLDLSHNSITIIDDNTFGSLPALEELRLQHNDIEFIDQAAFSKLDALKVLYLHNNVLKHVRTVTALPSDTVLSLASNPWSCDCEFMDIFLKFLLSHRDNIVDYASLRCFWEDVDSVPVFTLNGTFLHNLSHSANDEHLLSYENHSSVLMSEFQYGVLCSNRSVIPDPNPARAQVTEELWHAVVGVVVVVVVAVVVGVAGVRWRAEVQACVYVRLGIRMWDKAARMDRQQTAAGKNNNAVPGAAGEGAGVRPKLYDAFVSYSHQDEDFVVNTLVPRLEQQGRRQYRLCVHYRDFPVGGCIADTILSSVEQSQRTLLILSGHFLDSEWCRFEFRTAHQHVLQQGGHRLIMVLLEDLPDHRLDDDLRMAMKTRTYLTLKDPWFWEKLYFAMPDLPCRHPDDQQGPPLLPVLHPPQEDTEVRGDSLDTRANQILESLDVNVSREELVNIRGLAFPEAEEEDSVDDFSIKPISETAIKLDIPHPDSELNFSEESGNIFMLKQISDHKTDPSTRKVSSYPAQIENVETVDEAQNKSSGVEIITNIIQEHLESETSEEEEESESSWTC